MPVFCRMASPTPPDAFCSCLVSRITLFSIRLQISSAREHCQTIAFASGSFVLRSHAADVSRWLLMPRQAISSFAMPASVTTSCTT